MSHKRGGYALIVMLVIVSVILMTYMNVSLSGSHEGLIVQGGERSTNLERGVRELGNAVFYQLIHDINVPEMDTTWTMQKFYQMVPDAPYSSLQDEDFIESVQIEYVIGPSGTHEDMTVHITALVKKGTPLLAPEIRRGTRDLCKSPGIISAMLVKDEDDDSPQGLKITLSMKSLVNKMDIPE